MSTIEPPRPADSPEHRPPSTPPGSSGMSWYPRAPPPPKAQPTAPPPPPRSVRAAVRLMQAGAAISLLSLVVIVTTLGSKEHIRDRLEQDGRRLSDSALSAGHTLEIAVTAVAGLIVIGLWLWMASKNDQGRPWARIVATVLAGINVLFTTVSITSGILTTVASIIAVLNVTPAVVILVLLWRTESSGFYTARSRRPGPTY